jgi:hypothetical protein
LRLTVRNLDRLRLQQQQRQSLTDDVNVVTRLVLTVKRTHVRFQVPARTLGWLYNNLIMGKTCYQTQLQCWYHSCIIIV